MGVVYRTRAYCAHRWCRWGLFTGQGPTVLAVGPAGGVIWTFLSVISLFFLHLSLGDGSI